MLISPNNNSDCFVNKMNVKKTYPKILLLIFSSSAFFILLYLSLFYYTKQAETKVYSNSVSQFENEVTKLIELDTKPIQVAINNDTNWDEFVNFIKSKDSVWYNETIGNELNIYNADYLGAYDIGFNFMIRTASAKMKSKDIIPKEAMLRLSHGGISKFYLRIPEGLAEVTGASIHPSDDPLKNKTAPAGYFFVARIMDAAYLKNLESISESKVSFIKAKHKKIQGKHSIFSQYVLNDAYGKVVANLLFERKFDVYFGNMMTILYLIIFAFILNLIINIFYTRKLVYYPLEMMTRVL